MQEIWFLSLIQEDLTCHGAELVCCNYCVCALEPMGKWIGYPLQYSWASLVTQPIKNPPAMQETWDRSLVWKYPLEKGKATTSSILAWRIPWTV